MHVFVQDDLGNGCEALLYASARPAPATRRALTIGRNVSTALRWAAMSAPSAAASGSAPRPPDGDTWLGLLDVALPTGVAQQWVVRPDCGGVVVFVGTVRDHAEGRTGVTLLEYEAYEEQVEPVLARVAEQVRRSHPGVGRLALLHRIGPLDVTDAAVLVAASAPHRDEAFAAARLAIDEVKAQAPIWKREHWAGGVDWGRCDHDRPHDHGHGHGRGHDHDRDQDHAIAGERR